MSINYGDICREYRSTAAAIAREPDLAGLVRELRLLQRRAKREHDSGSETKNEMARVERLVDRELGLLPWE